MKLRKFNDFKKVYENSAELMPEPTELSDELMMSGETKTAPTKPLIPTEPEKPQTSPNKIEQPVETPQRKANVQTEEEEEVNVDEISQKMIELFDFLNNSGLGESKMENGTIFFDLDGDKYEIDFVSETMSFSVNGEVKVMNKGKRTILRSKEEVLNYLENQIPHQAPSQTSAQGVGQRKGTQQTAQPVQEKFRRIKY